MSKFQSVSLPSLSDSASMREVENESRKMGLDLLSKINTVADSAYPVGATYTQYPGTSAPSALFGGSWQDITATSLPVGVYDSGSNANGSWIRYTDGTMDMWGQASSVTNNGPLGNWYGLTAGNIFYSSVLITFPIQFVGTIPITNVTDEATNGNARSSGTSLTSTTLQSFGTNGGSALLRWRAIGKWSSSPVYPVTLWKRVGGTLQSSTSTTINSGIYDSGTNANGSWIRFTDGTMQVWWNDSGLSTTTNVMIAATLWYVQKTVTFPVAFISVPEVSVGLLGQSQIVWGCVSNSLTTITGTQLSMVSPAVTGTGTFAYQAIGKWK